MKIGKLDSGLFYFDCPGCECSHQIDVSKWNFNFNVDSPTVSPSILVKGTQPITDDEHALIMSGGTFTPKPLVCHSYVKNGKIEFLNDSTHNLAGQTVELPEID